VTRGKQRVVILAQPMAMAMAFRTQKSSRRLTHLPARLSEISKPPPLAEPPDRGPESIQMPKDGMSPRTLQGMIEEFVTRDGTDYGEQETELAKKVARVKAQLRKGPAGIFFYPDDESFKILPTEQVTQVG
jgi:uncharacterized protein YheU (UPF0270 family)